MTPRTSPNYLKFRRQLFKDQKWDDYKTLFTEEIENTTDIATLSWKCLFAVTGLKQTDVNISLFQYGQANKAHATAIQNFR